MESRTSEKDMCHFKFGDVLIDAMQCGLGEYCLLCSVSLTTPAIRESCSMITLTPFSFFSHIYIYFNFIESP